MTSLDWGGQLIGGAFSIYNNSALEQVAMDSVRTVTGLLSIYNNPSLMSVSMAKLTTISSLGQIVVANNRNSSHIGDDSTSLSRPVGTPSTTTASALSIYVPT